MKNIKGFFYTKLKSFTLNTTFDIKLDKITMLIGESGSGKTTFLKCISGLIKPEYAYLKINEKIIIDSTKNIFVNANKRHIGHVFQTPCLFPNMSVLKNITFKQKFLNTTIYTQDSINKILNLEKLYNRKIYNLSGGEKQRVAIAQILSTQPNIILLDEAFSSQDVNMKKKLIQLFRNINEDYNIPIIYVSHDISNLNKFEHNLIYINNGKINYTK